jgi:hypothetical protein
MTVQLNTAIRVAVLKHTAPGWSAKVAACRAGLSRPAWHKATQRAGRRSLERIAVGLGLDVPTLVGDPHGVLDAPIPDEWK